jgi:nitroreductase
VSERERIPLLSYPGNGSEEIDPMKIIETILSRKSIRRYSSMPVEDQKIRTMIESARLAPSGMNTQPWNYILVQKTDTKKRIAAVCKQKWMLQAPIFIVCVADIRVRINNGKPIVLHENSPQLEVKQIIRDTSISIEHLILQAESLGLSTCWVGYFIQDDIRSILNIPADKYVVAVITVGYGDEYPDAKPRRPIDDLIHYEIWGEKKEPVTDN